MKNTIILSLITMGLFFSCSSSKYTPTDYPDPQIIFGSGGGFTGMYTDYILFENGQLFTKKSNEEGYTALPKAASNTVKQLFKNYEVLDLANYQYSKPGNMNYYIKYKDESGEHRIAWGDMGEGLKNEVKIFYQMLNGLVKKK